MSCLIIRTRFQDIASHGHVGKKDRVLIKVKGHKGAFRSHDVETIMYP
jgi:hypothetical protein